jgi:P-type Cu+ transporter
LKEETNKYLKRFLISLAALTPILALMWIVPFAKPEWMTQYELKQGVSAYIIIICVLSTFIQFFLGAPFYVGAYKSIKNYSANMDVLVVLGTTSAWAYGIILIFLRLCITDDSMDMSKMTPSE